MRYWLSVPLMLMIVVLTSALGWYVDFNFLRLAWVVSAVAFGVDAHRLGAHRFKGALGQPGLAVAIVTFIAWPLAFPVYLSLRYKIVHGKALERNERDRRISPRWAGAIITVVLLEAAMWLRASPSLRRAKALQSIASDVAMAPVSINLSKAAATVTVAAGLAEDSTSRRRLAEDIARTLVFDSEEGRELGQVRVQFVNQVRRGSVTETTEVGSFEWSAERLLREMEDRVTLVVTVKATGLTGFPPQCEAEGDMSLWVSPAEVVGHGSIPLECPASRDSAFTPRRVHLRLGLARDASVAPGADQLAPGIQGTPCATWGGCVCPLHTGWAIPISTDLSCSTRDGGEFTVSLRADTSSSGVSPKKTPSASPVGSTSMGTLAATRSTSVTR